MPPDRCVVHANAEMSHPVPKTGPAGFDERSAGRYQGSAYPRAAWIDAGRGQFMCGNEAGNDSPCCLRLGPVCAPLKAM